MGLGGRVGLGSFNAFDFYQGCDNQWVLLCHAAPLIDTRTISLIYLILGCLKLRLNSMGVCYICQRVPVSQWYHSAVLRFHIMTKKWFYSRARLKQNLWPVIMLIEDLGANEKPYFHDLRTQRITTAVSLAKSEKFLVSMLLMFCLRHGLFFRYTTNFGVRFSLRVHLVIVLQIVQVHDVLGSWHPAATSELNYMQHLKLQRNVCRKFVLYNVCCDYQGLSVNAACLMRKEEDLLDEILSNNLICFVWGRDANNAEVRENLRKRNVHAICYDEYVKFTNRDKPN